MENIKDLLLTIKENGYYSVSKDTSNKVQLLLDEAFAKRYIYEIKNGYKLDEAGYNYLEGNTTGFNLDKSQVHIHINESFNSNSKNIESIVGSNSKIEEVKEKSKFSTWERIGAIVAAIASLIAIYQFFLN